jgi:tRNA(His) guanylyltransferase
MSQSKDTLGDRLKQVEQMEAGRKADREWPLMARLDGKAFHTFTRGLARPYDTRLSDLMLLTTCYLVEQTHAKLGYTQSDEISLYWALDLDKNPEAEYMYDGKFQKLTSVLASMAGAFFNKHLAVKLPQKADAVPVFDCRVWNVDDLNEVYLNFLWRQNDAIKNSISMAAQAHFSHNELHKMNSEDKKSALRQIGQPWEYHPMFFRMGTFVGKVNREVELTEEQLQKIPEKHRPAGPVVRSFIEDLNIGYLPNQPKDVLSLFF